MTIHLRAMVSSVIHPKAAFTKIAKDATLKDGAILMLAFTALGTLYSFGIQYLLAPVFISATSILISIPLGILSFFMTGLLIHLFAQAFDGKGTFSRTLGCIGHAEFAGLVVNIALTPVAIFALAVIYSTTPGTALLITILAVAAIAALVYSLTIYGSATSAAHNISRGKGIAAAFLGLLVSGILVAGVSFMLSLLMPVAKLAGA